jgi:hypothetical protein
MKLIDAILRLLAALLTVIFLILKIFGVIDWGFVWIISPILVYFLLVILYYILLLLVAFSFFRK